MTTLTNQLETIFKNIQTSLNIITTYLYNSKAIKNKHWIIINCIQ